MRLIWIVRSFLIAAAFLWITAGILNGEALEVYRKAAAVCLECIGIG